VAIKISQEKLLSLSEAARMLPSRRSGRPLSPSCIWRWINEGVRGPDGRTVKLEGVRLGPAWLTSVEALQRFGDRLTGTSAGDQPETPAKAMRSRKSVEAELDKALGPVSAVPKTADSIREKAEALL